MVRNTPVKVPTSSSNVGRCQEVQSTLYFVCDHPGKPKQKKDTEQNQLVKGRKRANPSIKVGCKANIECRILLDHTCEIIYHWQHSEHDPSEFSNLRKSRLPFEVKQWIENHVDNNMNWRAIKDLLRLSPEAMSMAEEDSTKVPLPLRINYHDIQNAISARLFKLSRKAYTDKESVMLWLGDIYKKDYYVLQDIESESFVIAWVSPWQRLILQRQEDVCVDSTHKTCKSFLNNEDYYLFTIVAKMI